MPRLDDASAALTNGVQTRRRWAKWILDIDGARLVIDGNDHVKWLHRDHLSWPHPRPVF